MDISKSESQNPGAARRQDATEYLTSLFYDLLCFLILFSVALLIVFAVFLAVDEMSQMKREQQQQRVILRVRRLNGSSLPLAMEENAPAIRRCLWPQWCRFVFHNCKQRHELTQPAEGVTAQPEEQSTEEPMVKPAQLSTEQPEKQPANQLGMDIQQDNSRLADADRYQRLSVERLPKEAGDGNSDLFPESRLLEYLYRKL